MVDLDVLFSDSKKYIIEGEDNYISYSTDIPKDIMYDIIMLEGKRADDFEKKSREYLKKKRV